MGSLGTSYDRLHAVAAPDALHNCLYRCSLLWGSYLGGCLGPACISRLGPCTRRHVKHICEATLCSLA